MPRPSVFAVADDKIARADQEMRRIVEYLVDYTRSGLQNDCSRTAAAAFAVHGIYTGGEDVP